MSQCTLYYSRNSRHYSTQLDINAIIIPISYLQTKPNYNNTLLFPTKLQLSEVMKCTGQTQKCNLWHLGKSSYAQVKITDNNTIVN